MAAFERIHSGIEGLDTAFDNIRLGDNVVWQLSSLDEFRIFVDPYVKQAIADGRDLVYMRFASHEALVPEQPGLTVCTLDPNVGFEAFTIACRRIITEHGFDAFYVFDCLSELQTAWSADMMMGNFFYLTCPYLFILDTVAFFPVLRGRHSFETIAKIRDTTQLLIDVCPDEDGKLFVHPLKVWQRYSPTMFMPHLYDPATGAFEALTDGLGTARFYARMNEEQSDTAERNIDSWDRFFMHAELALEAGTIDADTCTKMCNMMMTKDLRMREMVKRFFEPEDYFDVRNRMVGTGLVGGKACGMLLARKIVEALLPQYATHFEPHDSFYIGTDVFYTYIVSNDLWKLRIKQRSAEGFVKDAPDLQRGILEGRFPSAIRESFERILDYYGQCPIIVRSSSFLEDGFGNAFAGKYESVFCPNIGPFEDRLAEFEHAVKYVYASMMDPSALEYRLRNGLDTREEQMALLVQRVSGSHYSAPATDGKNGAPKLPARSYFMPTAAGVGYSHSAYCWMDDMDPEAGMLRLVMGLGTKAVDRTGRDYPRILSLDRPLATTTKTVAEAHRFSQRTANYIDVGARRFAEAPVTQMADALPRDARYAVYEHDVEAERRLRETGHRREVLFASCRGLAANREFTNMMRDILCTLQECYEYPVDIEYTINVGEGGGFVVNLLQCRPLQALRGAQHVDLPALSEKCTLLQTKNASMGSSRRMAIDAVILIDPKHYYHCPHNKKSQVATQIGRLNTRIGATAGATGLDAGAASDPLAGANCLLLAPGRLGTSSPELGVPVSFANISNIVGVFEVGYSGAGYSPELSYGSHMFQDLVEADIFYGAVFENEKTQHFAPELLDGLLDITPPEDDPDLQGIFHVVNTRGSGLSLWHDMLDNQTLIGFDR